MKNEKKITKFIDFWRRLVTTFALYESFIVRVQKVARRLGITRKNNTMLLEMG